MEKLYLNHKISPFTIPKHIRMPIYLRHNSIPYGRKANLIPRSKMINIIEPKTSENIRNRNVFLYDNTTFRDICESHFHEREREVQYKILIN